MVDGHVVGGDEEADGVEVVLGVLGEGVGLAGQAAHPRPQRAEPALHMVGLAFVLAAAAMRLLWKRGGVGIPEVAAGGTTMGRSARRFQFAGPALSLLSLYNFRPAF